MFLLKSLQFIVRPFSLRYGEREFEGNLMRGLYFMQNKFSCFSRLVKIHMEKEISPKIVGDKIRDNLRGSDN